MARGFKTGSDNEKIDELQRQFDDIVDSQINSVGGNDNISIDSTRGSRNDASGDAGGIRSNEPIPHQITDVDEGGTPTGVFDKINIISSMAIIDHTSTPITLRFIQGTVKDGARIKITPKIGKTTNIESGGNILTSSTITISDGEYYELVKYSEAETGVTGGAYKIFLSGGGGGGGVSLPITPPIDDRGVVTTNQTFILSNTTGHVLKLELGADIDIIFDSFPINNVQQEWEVEIIQDGTTPFVITWPVSVVNPPDPSAYAVLGSTTVVAFRSNDGGTTIRVGNPIQTTPASSFSGDLSDLVIDVNKDWSAQGISNLGALTGVTNIDLTGAITGVTNIDLTGAITGATGIDLTGAITGATGIDLDGATATISGVQLIDLFQANQQIDSTSSGITYQVGDLQSHLFKSQSDNIASFEESGNGIFRLDMLDHTIERAKDIRFDDTATFTIPGGTPGIGFDSPNSRFVINYPTGASVYVFENFFIGTTIFKNNSIESNIVTANDLLQLGLDATVPTVVGEFRNDGTDVTTFSGGAVRNFSNIPVTAFATIALDNLSSVAVNASISSATDNSIDLGSEAFRWRDVFTHDVRFGLSGVAVTGARQIYGDSAGVVINFPTSLNLRIKANAVDTYSFTAFTFTAPNVLINDGELFFNDGTIFPAVLGGISRNGSALGIKFDEVSIRRNTTVAADIPVLSLTRVDASPGANDGIARINFNIFDSPTETTYASIDVAVTNVLNSANLSIDVFADGGLLSAWAILGDDSTQNFTILAGGLEPRIQPANGPMAYFVTSQVTDFSLNVGNSGTLECPRINDGSPSVNDLNSAGGAFNTSLFVHDISDGTLYVKNSNTQWDAYARTGTVT